VCVYDPSCLLNCCHSPSTPTIVLLGTNGPVCILRERIRAPPCVSPHLPPLQRPCCYQLGHSLFNFVAFFIWRFSRFFSPSTISRLSRLPGTCTDFRSGAHQPPCSDGPRRTYPYGTALTKPMPEEPSPLPPASTSAQNHGQRKSLPFQMAEPPTPFSSPSNKNRGSPGDSPLGQDCPRRRMLLSDRGVRLSGPALAAEITHWPIVGPRRSGRQKFTPREASALCFFGGGFRRARTSGSRSFPFLPRPSRPYPGMINRRFVSLTTLWKPAGYGLKRLAAPTQPSSRRPQKADRVCQESVFFFVQNFE